MVNIYHKQNKADFGHNNELQTVNITYIFYNTEKNVFLL